MSNEKQFDVSQFGDEIKRILVVAAHPDDLETTSGGTLALLIARGRGGAAAGHRRRHRHARPQLHAGDAGRGAPAGDAGGRGRAGDQRRVLPRPSRRGAGRRPGVARRGGGRLPPLAARHDLHLRPGLGRAGASRPHRGRPCRGGRVHAVQDGALPPRAARRMASRSPMSNDSSSSAAATARAKSRSTSRQRGTGRSQPHGVTSANSARRKRRWNGWPRGTTKRGSAVG